MRHVRCASVFGVLWEQKQHENVPHMGPFSCWSTRIGKQLNLKTVPTRAGFLGSVRWKGVTEHKNMQGAFIFGGGWAEEALNTQNAPYRHVCVFG